MHTTHSSQPMARACLLFLGVALLAGLAVVVAPARVVHAADITVTTTDDELNVDDDCSLREAIVAANTDTAVDDCTAGSGADVIILPTGTYTLTIEGSGEDAAATGDLDITDDLTITGAGASTTIIDAGGMIADPDRVFHIAPSSPGGASVEISDLTITNGDAGSDNGGGILLDWPGTLVLSRCTITGNTAGDHGGGIYSTHELQLIDSIVSSNQANNGGGIGQYGDDATLSDSRVTGNVATFAGGGIVQDYGHLTLTGCVVSDNSADSGGGIRSYYSTVQLTGTTISDNSASTDGGAIRNNLGAVMLTNCIINGNSASYNGGGIHNTDGALSLIDSTVADNSCHSPTGARGAGIANWGQGTVTLSGCSVSSNSATATGGFLAMGGGIFNAGALLDLATTTISENSADDEGGGIDNLRTMNLTNCTISGNSANTSGAILSYRQATLTNVTVAWNSTTSGGAIRTESDGEINLHNTIVANQPSGADCTGNIVSQGYNLDTDDTCNLTYFGDLRNTDPKIGPLQDNGGPTLTHALLESSPAIDAGDDSVGLTTDQRGAPRPVAGSSGCVRVTDIGAYEAPGFVDLYVSKEGTPNPVIAGEELFYNLTIQNWGDATATNVLVTDTLPAQLEYLSDTDNCSVVGTSPSGGQILECNFGTRPGCVSLPFEIKARVKPNAVALEPDGAISISNSAWATSDQEDHDSGNNSVTEDTFVQDEADLRVLKISTPDDAVAIGEVFTYTIYVDNLGPSYAREVRLNDEIFASGSLSILAWVGDPDRDDTCTVTDTTVECQLNEPLEPQGDPAGDGRWTVLIRVQADERQDVDNVVTVFTGEGGTPDPDPSNNVAEDAIHVGPADLEVVKGVGYTGGTLLLYSVAVTNHGPDPAVNVVVEDLLPEPVRVVDITTSQGSCTSGIPGNPAAPLTCNLGELAPEADALVEVRVLIDEGYEGYLENDALVYSEVYDPDNSNNRDTVIIQVQPPPVADLSIEKWSEPVKVFPGDQKIYHVEVTNNGPSDAESVVVSDTLPIELTYQIDTDNCDLVGGPPDLLRCDLGMIPAGESVQFDIHALVDPDYPVTGTVEITNTADVWMETEEVWESNWENNSDWTTNLILPPNSADLGIDKWWSEAPPEWFDGVPWDPEDCYLRDEFDQLYGVRAGCPLRYRLVVTNSGPLLAENVVVEDPLPAGVAMEGVGAPGSCTTGIPGDPSAPLTCNLGNIPAGEDRWIDILVVTGADLASELLENDAVVSSDIFDPDNGNNRAHVLIWVEPFSYLGLVKEGPDPPEVNAGEEIHYWLHLWNDGPSTAHDVHLDDWLPGPVWLVDAEVMIGDGSCAPDTTLCSLGDVAPNEGRWVRVRGHVDPWMQETTIISNTVVAWAHTPFNEPAPEQPISYTLPITVNSRADLSIHKTGDPFKVYAGEQVRYDIEVTNNGPGTAFNVMVTDTLDPGVEFEIATTDCEIIYTESMTPTMLGATRPDMPYSLFSVDLGTGAGSFIGEMPEWLAAEIEYDNLSGRLFASMGFDPWYWDDIGPRLYEIDPETGGSLGYVDLEEPCALPGLEFVGDTLYGACSYDPGWHGGRPDLYRIDPDTGQMSYVGDTNLDDRLIHGLAYDESSETMYGLTVWPWAEEGPNELVTIDLDDGEAHWVCDIWDADYEEYKIDLRSIEFGPDGLLYGGLTWDSDLVVIDTSPSNGECDMTHVGDTGFSVTGLTLADLRTPIGTECHLGEIPPGETREFSIFVRVKPDTLGMINNEVEVWSDTEDPDLDNNSDSDANLVLGKADLKVTKFGKPDGEVRAGEELEYTVIVDNLGPGYAHDVVLYDLITSNSWEWHIDGWDSDRPASCTRTYDGYDISNGGPEPSSRLTCRLADPLEVMSPYSSGRWVLKVFVDVSERQSINNVADVVSSDYDPDLSNNQAIVEHDITAVADLELHKEAWSDVLVGCEGATVPRDDEVAAGGMLEYTLSIRNYGPSTAENVVVEDWGLSPFLEIVDVQCVKDDSYHECSCITSELGELGDTNRRLKCNLGTLDSYYFSYDEDQIIITARVPSDVPEGSRLVNDAMVYSGVFDDDNGNDFATNWTTVIATADLEVEKTQEPETALPGMDVTYTITVTNLGPSDAYGVIVSDTMPVTMTDVTVECCASDDGECYVPCEPPTCPAGHCTWPDVDLYVQADIPAGEWVIYTVTGTGGRWPCDPITNTVEVIAPQSLVHPLEDIDPCDPNVASAVNDPTCYFHFVPLVLKEYPAPDTTP